MRTKVLGAVFALALIAGGAPPLLATGAAYAAKADKVVICHSTRSEKNPLVFITVSGERRSRSRCSPQRRRHRRGVRVAANTHPSA